MTITNEEKQELALRAVEILVDSVERDGEGETERLRDLVLEVWDDYYETIKRHN